MRVEELRIGNLVTDKYADGTKYITKVDVSQIEYPHNCEPIPLTEEWLVKLGFDECYKTKHKQGILKQYSKSRIKFDVSNSGNIYYSHKNIPIYDVHQLQNLYFALTGEELKTLTV